MTSDALAAGKPGFARYESLISYLCDLLRPGRDECPDAAHLPKETERALAGGIATLVAQRVDLGRHGELSALVPEAIQFVLTPYLGIDEARRVGNAAPLTSVGDGTRQEDGDDADCGCAATDRPARPG